MIVVFEWCDGFGNDGRLSGIYENLELARKNTPYKEDEFNPPVFFDVEINRKFDCFELDYYDGKKLFSTYGKKSKNKKKGKRA